MSDVVVAGHVSLDLFPQLYGPLRLDPRVGIEAEAWRGREVLSPCFSPRTN